MHVVQLQLTHSKPSLFRTALKTEPYEPLPKDCKMVKSLMLGPTGDFAAADVAIANAVERRCALKPNKRTSWVSVLGCADNGRPNLTRHKMRGYNDDRLDKEHFYAEGFENVCCSCRLSCCFARICYWKGAPPTRCPFEAAFVAYACHSCARCCRPGPGSYPLVYFVAIPGVHQ
jgi:hypothetical protein